MLSHSVVFDSVTHQVTLSMGVFRQEHRSGLPFSPPQNLLNPGIEPTSPASPALQVDSLPIEPSRKLILRGTNNFPLYKYIFETKIFNIIPAPLCIYLWQMPVRQHIIPKMGLKVLEDRSQDPNKAEHAALTSTL